MAVGAHRIGEPVHEVRGLQVLLQLVDRGLDIDRTSLQGLVLRFHLRLGEILGQLGELLTSYGGVTVLHGEQPVDVVLRGVHLLDRFVGVGDGAGVGAGLLVLRGGGQHGVGDLGVDAEEVLLALLPLAAPFGVGDGGGQGVGVDVDARRDGSRSVTDVRFVGWIVVISWENQQMIPPF